MSNSSEEMLQAYLRQLIAIVESCDHGSPKWRHRSANHLLSRHGRFFTPAALPEGVEKMPDRQCFGNAALLARTRRDLGLAYAEGFAVAQIGGLALPVEHAWCVSPDGQVLDPTWEHGVGQAYFGIAVVDSKLWPPDSAGLLADADRGLRLLRNGIESSALSDAGRSHRL